MLSHAEPILACLLIPTANPLECRDGFTSPCHAQPRRAKPRPALPSLTAICHGFYLGAHLPRRRPQGKLKLGQRGLISSGQLRDGPGVGAIDVVFVDISVGFGGGGEAFGLFVG